MPDKLVRLQAYLARAGIASRRASEELIRAGRVRVNGILPGPVLFPPNMPEAEREEAIRSTLVRREGHPKNVAAAVIFLVENEFVTGVCLPVDGGRTIYAAGH